MDPAMAVRYAEYRLATNIFYRQGLVLWTLLGGLVAWACSLWIFCASDGAWRRMG